MNLTRALCDELGAPPMCDAGAIVFVVDDNASESLELVMQKMKADSLADPVRMGAKLWLAPPGMTAI